MSWKLVTVEAKAKHTATVSTFGHVTRGHIGMYFLVLGCFPSWSRRYRVCSALIVKE